MTQSGSLPLGGICKSSSVWWHRLDQQALVRLAGHDGGPLSPPWSSAAREARLSLPRFLALVAGVAVRDEHRANLALEEIEVGLTGTRLGGPSARAASRAADSARVVDDIGVPR